MERTKNIGKRLNESSPPCLLDPFLEDFSIIRVGRYSIILPIKSKITEFIVNWFHSNAGQSG